MISEKTYSAIKFCVLGGYYLRVMPWIWNSTKHMLVHEECEWKLRLWKFTSLFFLVNQTLIGCYNLYAIAFLDIEPWETIMLLVPLSVLVATASSQILILTSSLEIATVLNSAFSFNDKMARIYRINQSRTDDGMDKFRKVVIGVPITMTLLTGPAFASLLSYNLKSLEILNRLSFIPGWKIFVGLGVMNFIMVDCALCFSMFLVMIAYFNGTALWLKTWTRNQPSVPTHIRDRRQILQRYRTLQVIHYRYLGLTGEPTSLLLAIMSVFVIVTFYSFIYLFGNMNNFFVVIFASMGAMIYFIAYYMINLINRITQTSKLFLGSFPGAGKWEKRFLHSCQFLHWRAGHFFKIKQTTFPRITQDVIITSVVNLLLTWKRPRTSTFQDSSAEYY